MSLLPHDWFYNHDSGVEWATVVLVRELVNQLELEAALSHHALQEGKMSYNRSSWIARAPQP